MRAIIDINETMSNECEITVLNGMTGKLNRCIISQYTVEEMQHAYKQWHRGELIQNVLPKLSPEQREMLITGMSPEEQETIYGDEE